MLYNFLKVKKSERVKGQKRPAEVRVEKDQHRPQPQPLHPSHHLLPTPISRLLWQPQARPKLKMA